MEVAVGAVVTVGAVATVGAVGAASSPNTVFEAGAAPSE